jgi:hypothetical protein
MKQTLYTIGCVAITVLLVVFDAPSWLALGAGLAIALVTRIERPKQAKLLTTLTLQLGVMALGAGMNLETVLRVGVDGALVTATGLAIAVTLGLALGRWFDISKDTSLLIAVGTGICGGSAIAAVSSVIRPKDYEMSIALAVVFVLNAVALILFPVIGHLLGMSEPMFGRWAALAIHDTSSVVGAGLSYGAIALDRAGHARDRGAAAELGQSPRCQVAVVHPRVRRDRRARHLGPCPRALRPAGRARRQALAARGVVPDRAIDLADGTEEGRPEAVSARRDPVDHARLRLDPARPLLYVRMRATSATRCSVPCDLEMKPSSFASATRSASSSSPSVENR